jgi:hypothetical protein
VDLEEGPGWLPDWRRWWGVGGTAGRQHRRPPGWWRRSVGQGWRRGSSRGRVIGGGSGGGEVAGGGSGDGGAAGARRDGENAGGASNGRG